MKRRAAPNRQSAGVSLFPFLAVLLCTMGALIVVLVVIARQARLQVIATADAAPDEALAARRANLEWRIAQLRQSREATQQALADKQTELSHLEEHSRRLRDQLEELASARERLGQMAAGDERDKSKLKSELDRLQHRVTGLRGELGKLMEKARDGQQSYAVVPYRGPNETYRRPIYIECRATGVVFQPSGLTLTEQDFAIDDGLGNPLASAVRAAREYYLRNSLKGEGETGSAYPLMIVRPDGVLAYLAARKVLESLGPDFGYELVAPDWQIEYPSADPLLVLAMKQAISEGRMRQAYLASAAPGLFFNRRQVSFRSASQGVASGGSMGEGAAPNGGLRRPRSMFAHGRPSGVAGGVYGPGGSGRGGTSGRGTTDNPYLDALAEESAGGGDVLGDQQGSGFRVQGSGIPGPRTGGVGTGGLRGGSSYVGNRGIGGIGIGGGNAGDPLAVNASGINGQRAGGAGQKPGPGVQGSGFQGSGSKPPGSAVAGSADGGLEGTADGRPPPADGGTQKSSGRNGGGTHPELASAAATGPGKMAGAQGNGSAGGSAQNGPGGADRVANASAAGAGNSGRTANAAGAGAPNAAGSALATDDNGKPTGTSANDGAARSQGTRQVTNGPSSGGPNGAPGSPPAETGPTGSGTNSGLASTSRGGAGGSSGGNTAQGARSPGGGASNSGASGAGASSGGSTAAASGSMGSNMMQPRQMGMPTPMIAMGAQPPAAQNSSRGQGTKRERNWANPDASTSSVPVERRIQIICDAEHLTVMPESRGTRGMKVIKLGSYTEDSLDELVSTVWDRIDSWGTAGRGMYWRPKLVMMIEPGGQRRYTELQSLLADSGFDVHGRPRTAKPRR